MDDVDPDCPSPRTAERRRRRAEELAKFQSDAAAAAKLNCHRHRYSTNVSYIPATNPSNPIFSELLKAAEVTEKLATMADAKPNDILPKDVPSIILALQSLRIQLIVDPALSFDELIAFCAETSRNEALAAANPANSVEFACLQQLRKDLESEIYRCKPKMVFRANCESSAKPTPHVRIALGKHHGQSILLGNILTSGTMHRSFVSINAFACTVSADIAQFITSPSRGQDRLTVLRGGRRTDRVVG